MESEYINCKNCKDDCRCRGKNITPICVSFKPVKTTKADRIRTMTDEELAEYLDGVCHDLWQMFVKDPQKMWLDWLKQEVENESNR